MVINNMKKVIVILVIVFVLVLIALIFLLTGNSSSNDKLFTMTCTYYEKADNEYESSTNHEEKYIYDGNSILKTMYLKEEYEYSKKELADRYKSSEEKVVDIANNYSGVIAKIETISDTKYIINYQYDVEKVDSIVFNNFNDYLDENKKFSVEEYKSYFESIHNNRNGKCTIVENK